jgi:hypothetical protein
VCLHIGVVGLSERYNRKWNFMERKTIEGESPVHVKDYTGTVS